MFITWHLDIQWQLATTGLDYNNGVIFPINFNQKPFISVITTEQDYSNNCEGGGFGDFYNDAKWNSSKGTYQCWFVAANGTISQADNLITILVLGY